jgi:hypothetical protein
MTNHSRNLAMLAVIAAGLLPATAAQAQLYGSSYAQPAPLYPYAVQQDQPYAVQVAPNTYEIRRPAHARAHPYVNCRNCGRHASNPARERAAPRFDRPHKPANRALIEELRNRSQTKGTVINTTKIVRDPPVVVETKRYVDDPPRVIERRHVVEDAPVRTRRKHAASEDVDTGKVEFRGDGKKRVIQADAEITILGPDRMSIRLFRKRHGPNAKSLVDE